jgi:esterase/lipase/1-acyl-sn-glycerol-3-phosphate acyltransferase
MNRFAYKTTGLAIKTLSRLIKAKVALHGRERVPAGSKIFVINHFTRVETLLLPYHINQVTRRPVWSLADAGLFRGPLAAFLDRVGVVSTRDPDRDMLIVKSLLTGEADWIIFPEGRMVKSKKIVEKGRFMISYAGGKHPPHTGAAALALRTEFYRQRLAAIAGEEPEEARRLMERFGIDDLAPVAAGTTAIVPVNITFYPIRAKENLISGLAETYLENLPERALEELMTEGTLLFSGADVDIRFGDPIPIADYLKQSAIGRDITSRRRFDVDDAIPSKKALRKTALTIMKRYMSAIYDMTTVNYDHLFASILKLHPRRSMDEYDLRRRVYLAIQKDLGTMGLHLHSSLRKEQLHLITDDRFHRFREFITLAEEKGVVRREGERIIKNPEKFASPLDFHRIRIDNPVSVIANEVEPLKPLQKTVRRLAWTPRFRLRSRIFSPLLEAALAEFQSDYDTFYLPEESHEPHIGRPFLIRGKSHRTGVLLIHGYMAAPFEVAKLALFLGRQGYWVYAPRLRGHGTAPEDLALRTHADWIRSVDEGYAVIRNICKEVVLGGFSTGAALALDLAARVGAGSGVAGVFAISPPRRLQDLSVGYSATTEAWQWFKRVIRRGDAHKSFIDNIPENPRIGYLRNPVSGIREVESLMETIEPRFADVTIPSLVIHTTRDPRAETKGSRRIFDQLGSEEKRYVLFDFERHCIILGDCAIRVHRVIGDFIANLKGV